jgi:hypothetical protein
MSDGDPETRIARYHFGAVEVETFLPRGLRVPAAATAPFAEGVAPPP